ncbi:uncharacterized protein [Apostichopus japonicus]|uniref:uncharacterized protein isoform X2 n=1 Tax=Stichopus japonicus TaxID=307972 RepID=UPI003AB5126A
MSMNTAFILTLIVTSLPVDRSVLARNLMPTQPDCKNPQYIEVGKQAVIGCSFGIHFTAVYWYNVSSSYEINRPIAGYVVDDMLKIGTEYAEGTMDIMLNGDIVIKNVVTQHDGELKVVYTDENDVPSTAYIRVITFVTPNQNHPLIGSCEEAHYYQHYSTSELIKCSIHAIKPPVDLSLVKRLNGEDSPISTRNETTVNDDGTFNITISAEIPKDEDVSLQLLVCSYKWKPTESKKEASLLLELSETSDRNIKIDKSVDYVFDGTGRLSCSERNVDLCIWKKELDDGVPQVLGWSGGSSDGKITDKDNGVEISATGQLIFDRLKLEDEGIYQCVYNDGTSSKVTNIRLNILVTPIPPYPHIMECDDITKCTVHGNNGSLECSLMGVKPVTSLNWECDETRPIELKNFRNYIVQKDTVFDIRVTVDYEITRAPYCYENIDVRCVANEPVPTHFMPYTEVEITSDVPCKFSFPGFLAASKEEGFTVMPTKQFWLLLVMCCLVPIAILTIVYLIRKAYRKRIYQKDAITDWACRTLNSQDLETDEPAENQPLMTIPSYQGATSANGATSASTPEVT